MVKLLHYGLQRSGTFYLEALMKKNFKVKFLNTEQRHHPSCKHFRIYGGGIVPTWEYRHDLEINSYDDLIEELGIIPDGIIVISKHPYAWLVSYRELAKRLGWPVFRYHPLGEYALFYERWAEIADDRVLFVRYEDLLLDLTREITLDNLWRKFDLIPRYRTYKNVCSVRESRGWDRLNYYLDKEYMLHLKKKDFKAFDRYISKELLTKLGY